MNSIQLIIMLAVVISFVGLGFMLNRSIKKYEAKPKGKKKKGRNRYMPEAKKPGR